MTILMEKLGAVSEIIAGQSPSSSTYNQIGDGLPFYQGKADFGEWFPKTRMWCSAPVKISQPDDVLISVRAPVGPTNLCKETSCIGRGLGAIRAKSKILDSHYLIHFLRSNELKIASLGRGSTFSAITRGDLEDIEIPIPYKNGKPDVDEQKRIAAILDKADAIRRKLQQSLRLSDDFLRSIFLDMFGDPVTNPMGWKTGTASDVFGSFRYGTSTKCSETRIASGQLPVLRIPNVANEQIDWRDLKYGELPDDEIGRLRLQKGDVVFVRTNGNPNLVGRCAVFDGTRAAVYASYLIRGRLDVNAKVRSDFIHSLLCSDRLRSVIRTLATTSAGNYNINTKSLGSLPVIIPPLALQDASSIGLNTFFP